MVEFVQQRRWPGCRLLYRTLSNPAIASMHERHAPAPPSPPAVSVSRRSAELQQAHHTHSCIEKAAAVAVPTPKGKHAPILDFLSTPKKAPEASPSCMISRSATRTSEAHTPFSHASTPKYLKSPSAHAEQTLQVRCDISFGFLALCRFPLWFFPRSSVPLGTQHVHPFRLCVIPAACIDCLSTNCSMI